MRSGCSFPVPWGTARQRQSANPASRRFEIPAPGDIANRSGLALDIPVKTQFCLQTLKQDRDVLGNGRLRPEMRYLREELVDMSDRDIVAIGGSTGALDALKRIFADLPTGLPAAVFVVLHVGSTGGNMLAGHLERGWADDCQDCVRRRGNRKRMRLCRPGRASSSDRERLWSGSGSGRARTWRDPLSTRCFGRLR